MSLKASSREDKGMRVRILSGQQRRSLRESSLVTRPLDSGKSKKPSQPPHLNQAPYGHARTAGIASSKAFKRQLLEPKKPAKRNLD